MNPVTTDDLAQLLAASLGLAVARDTVRAAMTELGLRGDSLTFAAAVQVLELLTGRPGLVGISARLARTRFESSRARASRQQAPAETPPSSPKAPPSGGPPDLVAMLAPSLGDARARAVIAEAMVALGLTSIRTAEAALRVLEQLSLGEGPVAVTARFAKVRVHLAK